MLAFICISIYKLATNASELASKFSTLFDYLIQGKINLFLLDLNNIFILILPVIFVAMFVISIIRKVIKKNMIKRKVR